MKFLYVALPVLLLLATWHCKKDPFNCRDEKIGNIYFHGPSVKFFRFKGTERLIFKNKMGSELVFTCPAPEITRIPVRAEKLCDGANLQTAYKYYEGDAKTLLFQTNDGAYKIELRGLSTNVLLKTAKDTSIIDVFSATFFQYNTGASLSLISSERGNAAKIPDSIRQQYYFGTAIEDTTLNGTLLTDVFAGKLFEGAPSTDPAMIFSKNDQPVVAFVDYLNVLWLLDRVE